MSGGTLIHQSEACARSPGPCGPQHALTTGTPRHGFQTLETKTWTLDSLPGKRFMLIFMARPPQPPAAMN